MLHSIKQNFFNSNCLTHSLHDIHSKLALTDTVGQYPGGVVGHPRRRLLPVTPVRRAVVNPPIEDALVLQRLGPVAVHGEVRQALVVGLGAEVSSVAGDGRVPRAGGVELGHVGGVGLGAAASYHGGFVACKVLLKSKSAN